MDVVGVSATTRAPRETALHWALLEETPGFPVRSKAVRGTEERHHLAMGGGEDYMGGVSATLLTTTIFLPRSALRILSCEFQRL
jgi:hypothetical protein